MSELAGKYPNIYTCAFYVLVVCEVYLMTKAHWVWVSRRSSRLKGNPRFELLSRLKIAFFALHKRGWTGFSLRLENFAANSNAISFSMTWFLAVLLLVTVCQSSPRLSSHFVSCIYIYTHTYIHICVYVCMLHIIIYVHILTYYEKKSERRELHIHCIQEWTHWYREVVLWAWGGRTGPTFKDIKCE